MPRRYVLSKRERKRLLEELEQRYGSIGVGKNDVVEIFEEKNKFKILVINGVPAFIFYEDKWIPHLKYLLRNPNLKIPIIIVDMGAVKPLLRGADLMAPGIREIIGVFGKGDVVVVAEEKYRKPFVIGIALVDSDDIVSGKIKRGRVVENIHRIGDIFWNIL
ncbi:RNA-binding protein, containing PUA domain [Staphylothermus marinus F1]|uniref:RNA-binding protein, containing PUA domain n=1 Tax=Staphylothermus marinus (strain ATCC 43588 / DSM 3639 / JCM 9404 / F1) TaxID=399550 RepID=A3DN31_STAMF|nr:DUF1947 domain-containing protein [Staphylothermus marinus]ABN70041.1 RNA-binding protein, containing PUA domain [Staphylothermus marinus F1]